MKSMESDPFNCRAFALCSPHSAQYAGYRYCALRPYTGDLRRPNPIRPAKAELTNQIADGTGSGAGAGAMTVPNDPLNCVTNPKLSAKEQPLALGQPGFELYEVSLLMEPLIPSQKAGEPKFPNDNGEIFTSITINRFSPFVGSNWNVLPTNDSSDPITPPPTVV